MKLLPSCAMCVLLLFCALASTGQNQVPLNSTQYNKPQLFSDLPDKLNLDLSVITPLLELPVGASVKVNLSNVFPFKGVVVSKAENSGIKSTVIKCLNRQGATLTLSQTTDASGKLKLVGRMLSFQHGDVFEVVQENGGYILQKKNLHDLMSE